MGDFTGTTTVDVDTTKVFDYLSEISNLPKYFARMTSARPGDGREVKTTAKMPDGQEVQGDAWFTVDDSAQRIEWGSEGPNDYHGYVDVRPAGSGSEVEVHIHTTRVPDGNSEIQDGVRETLAKIKQQVEGA